MKEKRTITEKIQDIKDWAMRQYCKAVDWSVAHKEEIVIFGPVLIGSTIECIKIITKSKNTKEEKHLKDAYIYDQYNGHYIELKRKPKQREWVQIDQRRANGEQLIDILMDMGLLK